MRRALLACMLFACAGFAQTVEGSVTDILTGQPIAGVKVAIESSGKPAGEALTDGQGGFRIENLPPGQYTANFTKRGFQAPARDDASRKPFRLTATNPVRVDVRLTPLGKLSGRVLDSDGTPVADVSIQIVGNVVGFEQTTDKQGNFSAADVPPGSYLLWAHPRKSLKPPPPRGTDRMVWAPTFYPGVTDSSAATKVLVRPASDVSALDIRLRQMPVHHMGGVLLGERGMPAPKVKVTLESSQSFFAKAEDRESQTVTADDGTFEFKDVYDGIWRLNAEFEGSDTKLRAFTAVTMAGHDMDRVELRLTAPFSVSGTVVREDPPGGQARKAPMLVLLTPEGGGSGYNQGPVTAADGTFTINGIYPGRYIVRPIPPGAPYYLFSIRHGDRELPLYEPFDLTSGALPLTVVYQANGGGVRGTVENCGTATVILYPQDRGLQIPELEPRVACGENGRYEIANIRPGEYYGFAFDRVPGLESMFFGFSLDQALINQAARVTIRPGEFTSVDLRVTSRQ